MRSNGLLICLALTGCQQGVVGSGNVITTTRELHAFRRLAIASGINAQATIGTRALTVRADDNLEPLIETLVAFDHEGDALVVRLKEQVASGTMEVELGYAPVARVGHRARRSRLRSSREPTQCGN